MNDSFSTKVEYDQIALQWQRFASKQIVPKEALFRCAHLDSFYDSILQELVLSLSSYALADKLAPKEYTVTHSFSKPSSSWQHFKLNHEDSWWMRRFARRWPPRLIGETKSTTIQIDTMVAFPHSGYYPENLGKPVIIQTVNHFDLGGQS